jgi:glycosyltransferase involved in cell wall biosynthesis
MSGGEIVESKVDDGWSPELSVVVCTRNMAPWLADQLNAILKQSPPRTIEVIVVDNGSTDDTTSVLEPFSKNGMIRVITCEEPGLNRSRNVGIGAARAPFVALCDADDRVQPGWLEAFRASVEPNVFCGGALWRAGNNDQRVRLRWDATAGPSLATFRSAHGMTPPGGNCCFSHRLWEDVGRFDERLSGAGDETEFFDRALKAGYTFRPVPAAVVAYRMPDSGMSSWRRGYRYGRELARTARLAGQPEMPAFALARRWAVLTAKAPLGVVRRRGRYLWIHRVAKMCGVTMFRLSLSRSHWRSS